MYRTPLFFLALIFLGSCQDQGNRLTKAIERLISKGDKDLHIADTIQPPRSGYDRQLPATKLFVDVPLVAVIDSARSRINLDRDTYIAYAYEPGVAFEARAPGLQHSVDSIARTNPGIIYYTHQFQLGSCQALLFYAKSRSAGKDKLILFFGDRTFSTYAEGEFPMGNKDDRSAVLKTLLSFYRDEDATEEASTLMPYTLDLSNTDFAYCTHTNYAFFYTIDGRGRPYAHADHNQIMVFMAPPVTGSIKNARPEVFGVLSQSGIQVVSSNDRVITVGGKPSLEIEGYITIDDNAGMFYALLTGEPTHPVCVLGVLYKDPVKRLTEVERIGRSFRLKSR